MSWVGTKTIEGDSTGGADSTVTDGDADSEREATDATLTKDDLFHVLQNERRRWVLNHLRTTGRVDVGELAERVAGWENGKEAAAVTSDERQRAYIALYQSHLPKLDGMGVVEYDQNRGEVERTELADGFDPYLDIDAEVGIESDGGEPASVDGASAPAGTTSYAAAALVGLALTSAMWAGIVPAVPIGWVAAVATALFGAVTLGLVIRDRR